MTSIDPNHPISMRAVFVIAMLACSCGAAVPTASEGSTGSEGGSGSDPTVADDTGNDDGSNAIQLRFDREVDILFVIDNSGSMGEEQGRLAASFGTFIGALESAGANYRIGVTTTDNGNPWCGSTSPEAGQLELSSCRSRTGQFVFNGNPPADATAVACTDVCSTDVIRIKSTATEFDAGAVPRPWLESSNGETNLEDDVTMIEALRCVGPQGIDGCGFESHLESMYKAFLRSANSDEEQYGFVRSNAILSIVILSDEVDCSYNNAYQSIFLPEAEGGNPAAFWSDPDASAPTSAVCWNAGVSCEGAGTPYDSCSATNKDTSGATGVSDDLAVLHPINRYIDFVQEIEQQKQQITPSQEVLVALIGGVPQGGEVIYANSPDPGDQGDFGIGPGCTYDDGDPQAPLATARPPVREKEFAESFAVNGESNLHSICQGDYSNVLDAIARSIGDQIRPTCMTACVADTDQITAGLQPECTLIQEAPDFESGDVIETNVPECLGGGALPNDAVVCFEALVGDALSQECDDEGWNLEFRLVRAAGVPAPPWTTAIVQCELSQNKAIDCPLLP